MERDVLRKLDNQLPLYKTSDFGKQSFAVSLKELYIEVNEIDSRISQKRFKSTDLERMLKACAIAQKVQFKMYGTCSIDNELWIATRGLHKDIHRMSLAVKRVLRNLAWNVIKSSPEDLEFLELLSQLISGLNLEICNNIFELRLWLRKFDLTNMFDKLVKQFNLSDFFLALVCEDSSENERRNEMISANLVTGVKDLLNYDHMGQEEKVFAFSSLHGITKRNQMLDLADNLEVNYQSRPLVAYVAYLERLIDIVATSPENMKMMLYLSKAVPDEMLVVNQMLNWGEWVLNNKTAEYMRNLRKYEPNEDYMYLFHPNGIKASHETIDKNYVDIDIKLPETYVPYKKPINTGRDSWVYYIIFNEKELRITK